MSPLYVFSDGKGETFERFYPAEKAPQIGATIRVGGKRYRRVATLPVTAAKPNRHFTSNALPRNWPYAKRHEPGTGKPQFDSMREVREAERRSQDAPHAADRMVYDP